MARSLYVINPAGHGGTGLSAWTRFEALWPHPIDPDCVVVTERRGHAREIATSNADCDTIVAVGGDGTANEVLSGTLDRPQPRPRLAIVPAGTGNDIARNAGVRSVEDAVAAMRDGCDREYDVIRADWTADGLSQHGYSFLQGTVGFSAVPGVRPWMKRLFGPTVAYYLGALLEMVAYRPPEMTILVDGDDHSGRTWMVVVGNSERTSGDSMCLSPGARLDDGELNVSIIPAGKSKLRMAAKMMPKLASGEHVKDPDITYRPAQRVEVVSDGPVVVDLDGDVVGNPPATFTVLPRALRVVSLKGLD